ncbi:MAG: hypothetical protein JST93_07575 [Acidobacteria bacterium]|nr:hypothetical protein [Acidobacteriota bacterium]
MYRFAVSVLLLAGPAFAGEAEALAISANIQARHQPFATILDPFLDANGNVTGFTRCGDSAIWTGHYLAAEAFRYGVTRHPEARQNALNAITGIRALMEVTGNNTLARCVVPKDSPFAAGILQEEAHHKIGEGSWFGRPAWWIGNTSRDQYVGIFFGLAVTWEVIDDPGIRAMAVDLVTRLLDRLLDDDWSIKAPDGETSTVFWLRPDQKLNLLAIGAKLNNPRYNSKYGWQRFLEGGLTGVPIVAELADQHNSYFKFNLDVLTFYHLIRFEGNRTYKGWYTDAYKTLRRTVDGHGNAHFNMIDRAIQGANAERDAETRRLLDEWLQRPRRDNAVDWRGTYPSCWEEDRACDPIPVPQRVRTDFLWQRSPFLLYGGGIGNIEGAGIDYILPYWMARYYGVL